MTLTEPRVARRVRAAKQLHGELRLPSDKSIAHRALLFNAMAAGSADVLIRMPGADVRSTAGVLRTLGVLEGEETAADGLTRFRIRGGGSAAAAGLPGDGGEAFDCGNSGTTVRFLTGALAGRGATMAAELTGDESLSRRPMERVAGPLRDMGATIETTDGRLPIRVRGQRPLRAIAHRLPVASAQVLGAISLAALSADGRTTIETPGPTRDHTERLLAWLGAPIRRDGMTTTIDGPAGLTARSLTVPGDLSSAAAWLVAASVHPDAEIRLRDVSLNPSRLAIVEVLREMGASIALQPAAVDGPEPTGDLLVRSSGGLRSIVLAGERIAELIDELPLLAVAMAAATGTSEVRDAAELRVKESDRIALVVRNLRAVGVDAHELPDGWRIEGLGGAVNSAATHAVARRAGADVEIETNGDHRIAISFAIAAAVGLTPEVQIDDPACVDVSYPGFWSDLAILTGSAS